MSRVSAQGRADPAPASAPRAPTIHLVRHGATAWSETGQHTGRTDLALLPKGEH